MQQAFDYSLAKDYMTVARSRVRKYRDLLLQEAIFPQYNHDVHRTYFRITGKFVCSPYDLKNSCHSAH